MTISASADVRRGESDTGPYPVRYLIDMFWIIGLAIYVLAGTLLVPFHGDESTLISLTRDYANLFLLNQPERVRFSDTPSDPGAQYLRLINGSLNIYGMGLAWQMAGFTVDDINDQWDWGAGWDYNQQNHHAPTPELLAATRWPGALFAAAGAAVMFALGLSLGGRLTAYLVSLYYALNPAILLNSRRATLEGSTIFFGILVVLAGIWLLRHRTWWVAIVLGIVSGLALASKHTNLFAVGAVFLACALYPILFKAERRTLVRSTAQIILAGILMLLTFYALNPVWWDGNALDRATFILRLRQDLLNGQMAAFGGYADLSDKVAGFARQALFALPQYYEAPEWGTYIGGEIARYEASVWRGVSVGGSWPLVIAFGAMIVVGVWALLRSPRITRPTRWLVGIWSLVIVVTILFLTPLEWQRYYLPVFPVLGLLSALGVTELVRRVRNSRNSTGTGSP